MGKKNKSGKKPRRRIDGRCARTTPEPTAAVVQQQHQSLKEEVMNGPLRDLLQPHDPFTSSRHEAPGALLVPSDGGPAEGALHSAESGPSLSLKLNEFVVPMRPSALAAALLSEPQGTCQKALRERRTLLIEKDRSGTLSLFDIREHGEFLCTLQRKLSSRGEALQSRAKVVSALLLRCRIRRRVEQLAGEMDSLHRNELCYNEDVCAFNSEREWFFTSKSFKAALEHVEENFVRYGPANSHVYLDKRELKQDSELDFDTLLQQMKREDQAPAPGHQAPAPGHQAPAPGVEADSQPSTTE